MLQVSMDRIGRRYWVRVRRRSTHHLIEGGFQGLYVCFQSLVGSHEERPVDRHDTSVELPVYEGNGAKAGAIL